MLAHEIKNPLASICGSIEVLRENGSFSDIKSKKLVDVVFKETERLQRILNEFLTFSEGSTIKKEKLDIKHLLDEIILVLENHSEIGNGKELKFKYDDSQNYYALLDEDQFKQMIYNLVINAAQAIENTGFICISLSKKFYAEKHYIQIEVEDSGKGIPDENKKNVFKPFFSTRTKGMGLGLNVCTKISQNHGWDISLRDRKQGGTIFRILIQQ
ncbi:MAG: sensor histidine kinase [uncultured bacterium]|nr:MAG: sensor histidine kinase [uncultured bacterium]